MDFRKSQTMQNLMNAFAGESQARQRYYIFGENAKDENLQTIAQLFADTEMNEREHAEAFFNKLTKNLGKAEMLPVTASYPVILGNTLENLKASIVAESDEANNIYIQFAKTARAEGFEDIAKLFDNIATVEKYHSERFTCYADLLGKGMLYSRPVVIPWHCTNCGFIYIATAAPEKCPVCGKTHDWFNVMEIC